MMNALRIIVRNELFEWQQIKNANARVVFERDHTLFQILFLHESMFELEYLGNVQLQILLRFSAIAHVVACEALLQDY